MTKELMHTPGPWIQYAPEINGVIDETYREIKAGCGYLGEEPGFCLTSYIREDDAKLIAAAPELLEACCEMLKAIESYGCSVDDPPTEKHKQTILLAKSAIDKATK